MNPSPRVYEFRSLPGKPGPPSLIPILDPGESLNYLNLGFREDPQSFRRGLTFFSAPKANQK